MKFMFLIFLSIAMLKTCLVWGHGRFLEPASRVSAWRFGYNTSIFYDDMGTNCGGRHVQWSVNLGKCGICGDDYSANVKLFETPGKYAEGVIVKTYQVNQVIDFYVEITANHLGFMQFRLCVNNDLSTDPKQDCFDQHVLKVHGENSERITIKANDKNVYGKLDLPKDVVCSQCIIQWTYYTGNNYGVCDGGENKLGCGDPETFRACADVKVQIDKVENQEKPNVKIDDKKVVSNNLLEDFCQNRTNGLFPYPNDCEQFIQCSNPNLMHVLSCPSGLHFNAETKVCDFKNNAGCTET